MDENRAPIIIFVNTVKPRHQKAAMQKCVTLSDVAVLPAYPAFPPPLDERFLPDP